MAKYQHFHDLPASQYEALKADIAEHGVLVPIVVDEEDLTIDGHQRRRAAAEVGVECPRQVIQGLDEDEKQGLAVALNAFRRHLSGVERSQAIQKLKNLGWSNRRVADAIGVAEGTVRYHEKKAGAQIYAPDEASLGSGDSEPDGPEAEGQGDDAGEIANPEPSPAPNPAPARVTGRDGKSYPAQKPNLEAIGQHLAENVPELTNGPAYRDAAKAIRHLHKVLKDIDPELAGEGAQRHEDADLLMEKVADVTDWLATFRHAWRPLKVVQS